MPPAYTCEQFKFRFIPFLLYRHPLSGYYFPCKTVSDFCNYIFIISYSLLCATIDKKEGEEEGIEGGQCKKVTKERLMEYNSNKREQAIMAIIQMRREVALFRRKEESPEKRFSMPGKSEGQSKDNL